LLCMTYEKLLTPSILILSLFACSAEKEKIARLHFEDTPDQTQKLTEADYHWSDPSLESDACTFMGTKRVEALPTEVGSIGPFRHFQLYQDIFADEGKITGAHAISKLPQVLF